MLESAVLTPLLVGDRIGLHPVAVIFAVLAGGQLFGFVGVLLALPTAAALAVLLRHLVRRWLSSEIYLGDAGLGATLPGDPDIGPQSVVPQAAETGDHVETGAETEPAPKSVEQD